MPTIADYLKYANLQMAAEAFLYNEGTQSVRTGQQLIDALKAGNNHASKFTEPQATDFAAHWNVVTQCPNTASGFSGTLFQSKDDPSQGQSKGSESFTFLN